MSIQPVKHLYNVSYETAIISINEDLQKITIQKVEFVKNKQDAKPQKDTKKSASSANKTLRARVLMKNDLRNSAQLHHNLAERYVAIVNDPDQDPGDMLDALERRNDHWDLCQNALKAFIEVRKEIAVRFSLSITIVGVERSPYSQS